MALTPLTHAQIQTLASQGCTAGDWSAIRVAAKFDPARVRNAHFIGAVSLGANDGFIELDGVRRPCGIAGATIAECEIGDNVLIANVGGALSNLRVESGAAIQNVAGIAAEPDAAFGNGVRTDTPNEGGGRAVTLFNGLNAQIAYILSIWRHNKAFIANLEKLIAAEVIKAQTGKAVIAAGARILNCGQLRNVAIGPCARIEGAVHLENGTVLSCAEMPSIIGAGVQAENFILSEGATVESGAIISNTFVGQGARVGRQFSAENSLIFANCECFHGEGCAIFAGPYTVSHHKSTLLIGTLYSFYNAGSGTNASNHMYKLGPCHQGIFERGCKTGSFAYVLLECHIGAFSAIIGKHMTNIDTPDMPFSYIMDDHGTPALIPGLNLTTIGTARDGEKWPTRDRRKMKNKRDLLNYEVYSPYTVEKMRRGRAGLNRLYEGQESDPSGVVYGGARVTRTRMRRGIASYTMAIARYLAGKVLDRIEAGLAAGQSLPQIQASLKSPRKAAHCAEWTDLSGMLALREKAAAIEADVTSGAIASIEELEERLRAIHAAYADDEWEYVCAAFETEFGVRVEKLSTQDMIEAVDRWEKEAKEMDAAILTDSKKEFGAASHIGYGLDQDEEVAVNDFEAVRGSAETNKVVCKVSADLEAISKRAADLREKIKQLG
ncbi:MAG: DUF4954 family protein [Candidatus Sumerlaeota bacterium]|nr:DUF4954 family protein [Candidatus Sumerlaeota bacterium]